VEEEHKPEKEEEEEIMAYASDFIGEVNNDSSEEL
jgi:hypothetical protein